MQNPGYFDSPWPGEDAGPARLQTAPLTCALNIEAGASLQATSRRTQMSTMTVLGAPGEVFLLTHSVLRSHLGFSTSATVSLIDPITLETIRQSIPLSGGPMWPGGMAVHANGSLIVVYGRYAHKLDRQCNLLKSYLLPIQEAYNSFVVLDNGLIVTKNLSDSTQAQLTTLHPESLKSACNDVICPEASIARLSAIGNTVYVVGVSRVWRYHWHEASQRLVRDTTWQCHYLQNASQGYAWDMVIDGDNGWLMDNGQHNYKMSMLGAGQNKAANRLIRISLKQSNSFQTWPVSGLPFGSITNPPLVDVARRIVVGFDSANRHLKAWRMISSRQHGRLDARRGLSKHWLAQRFLLVLNGPTNPCFQACSKQLTQDEKNNTDHWRRNWHWQRCCIWIGTQGPSRVGHHPNRSAVECFKGRGYPAKYRAGNF